MSLLQSRGGRRSVLVAALISLSLSVGILAGAPAHPAAAHTGSDFDPGYIISDSQFYSRDAMSEAEIQAFLDRMIGSCNNSNCLNIKRTDTFDRAQDRTVCNSYTGAGQELTSTILYKVQQACGISARVLLVTLQKENSLVTSRSPSDGALRTAMGYGCPDTSGCDAQFFGLYNQIYKAAWQFKRYSTPDYWGTFRPGAATVWYHPDTRTGQCGSRNITIINNATAALYNYTPYTPNSAALGNLGSYGDACSAYGNRNFWDFYYSWFGNPTGDVVVNASVNRIAGADRFETSALISQALGGNPSVVYVASGLNFPDGLSAAPAAALNNGPVLLVLPDAIPPSIAAELDRLNPSQIVVVGGEPSVSAAVFEQLKAYSGDVIRLGGPDRFATSLLIAGRFPTGTQTAYISTGLSFADALSAGSAAGVRDAPVILVNGAAGSIDSATVAQLQTLGVTSVIITGSENAVSGGIASSLAAALPGVTITRLGGANRFETAGLIVRNAFPSSSRVYLANGLNFPDALSGSALAAAQGAALLLSPPGCLQRTTALDITALGASSVTLFGQENALNNNVASFANCR